MLPEAPSTRYVFALGAVQTTISGRISGAHIEEMVKGYRANDKGSGVWLVLAEKATSYGPEAIQRAVELFADLQSKNGLRKLYAVLTAPTVRMGASVVSMGLRAGGSPLEIIVCKNLDEALTSMNARPKREV